MPAEKVLTKAWGQPESWTLAHYQKRGGYEAAKKALAMAPEAVIEEVTRSNLRGRGGAGFPTGMKWKFVRGEKRQPRYLVVNGDEGEPGTFKDRYCLELDPHMFIEGCIIAAWAIGAPACYVYLRGEFVFPLKRLEGAIQEAYAAGILGKRVLGTDFSLEMHTHRGAGAYICGEETALLESLEGKKGFPRLKPPFPAAVGLWGMPTSINNVETLSAVPHIIARGAEWFAGLGKDKSGGTRLFCISGQVQRPGVYEDSIGVTLRELVYGHAGGPLPGRTLKGVVPGGSSAAILTPDELDLTMDFDTLRAARTMAGSGGVIVFDNTTCIVRAAARVLQFYAHESCGQCTPCREGTGWVTRVLWRIENGLGDKSDTDLVLSIAGGMEQRTICALADGAAMPAKSYVQKYLPEFLAHVEEKRCPLGNAPGGPH